MVLLTSSFMFAGIPDFWLMTLKNCDIFGDIIFVSSLSCFCVACVCLGFQSNRVHCVKYSLAHVNHVYV